MQRIGMFRMLPPKWRRYFRALGKQTMKMRLHSNALSRQVPGITICDRCGTEEALEDAVHQPMDVHKWALIETYMKGANLK